MSSTFTQHGADVSVGGHIDSPRLIADTDLRLSEIVSALSVSLDIVQGYPQGHCMRNALIGMRLAQEIGLDDEDRSALFYALLLKDLGCSSNAAKIAYLFDADDQPVKLATRMIDWTKPSESLRHCWKSCAPHASRWERALKVFSILRLGPEAARKISEIRCERGANIARKLRLPTETAQAVYELDEHWNGQGTPCGLKGEEISLLGRICCLAQTVEVFYSAFGLDAAMKMAQDRRSRWFDPQLVDALFSFRRDGNFWRRLHGDDLAAELARWEPQDAVVAADENCLDRVAEGFAMVIDAKSPWTFQHSSRVAEITVGIASQFCPAPELLRDLRRAALLHDIGKLGVSNLILDKPGKPTDEEFAQIKRHPDFSQRILERVAAFQQLAEVASAHHERLDGNGYHRRLDDSVLPWAARVLTVADMYEAMSARRPYRDAMSWEQIYGILSRDAGRGVDPDCLHALQVWHERSALPSRVEAQLTQVDQLLSDV